MATRNTILLNTDPIIAQTKRLNVLLSQKQPQEIRDVLNDDAFPRVRSAILAARSAKDSNEGVPIWFNSLDELADATVQANVDALIDVFITANPLVKDAIWSIASRLACATLTRGLAGQVTPQANLADGMEKSALADLDRLVKQPFFSQTVEAFKEKKLQEGKMPRIYMALDIDDNVATYNATTNQGKPYAGAKVRGMAKLWLGWSTVDVITYAVQIGDTPAMILAGLSSALRSMQLTKQVLNQPFLNLVIAPDEGVPVAGTRQVQYKTYPAMTDAVLANPAITTNLSFATFSAYLYDKTVDFLNIELELKSESVANSGIYDTPGIPGLLYGLEPYYSGLTARGPHSVIIDLTTGERAADTTTTTTTDTKVLSDTFYFGIMGPGEPAQATATVAGTVSAADQFSLTVDGTTFTVTAGGGDTPNSIATALAAAIDSAVPYVSTAAGAVVTVKTAANDASGNGLAFTASTTSSTATLTANQATLANGINPNTLPTSGTVSFRSGEMIDPLNPVPNTVNRTRTVNVSRGEDVLSIVMKIANDLASISATSRILGAVRSPTLFKISGTTVDAPGLTIVPYTRDAVHYNVVFDMLSVPQGLLFAAMPYDLLPSPTGIFDDKPKSLVIPAKFFNPTSGAAGGTQPDKAITETDNGLIRVVQPNESPWFGKAIRDIKRL